MNPVTTDRYARKTVGASGCLGIVQSRLAKIITSGKVDIWTRIGEKSGVSLDVRF